MTSCALTNKPSQLGRIEPIINSSPIAIESIDIKENDMESIIERLNALEQLVSELTAKIEKPVENEEAVVEEVKEETVVEEKPVESEISESEVKEEAVNEKTIVVEEIDEEGAYIARTQYDAPEIDNTVIFKSDRELVPGDFVKVTITDAFDYDLVGRVEE
jgi:hypothetical protein